MATIKKPSFTSSLIIACFVLLISTTVSSANRLLKEIELEEAMPRAAARELVQGAGYGPGSGSQGSSYGSGSGGSSPTGGSGASSGTECYGGGVVIGGGCGISCGCGTVGGGVVIEIPGVQIPGINIPGGSIGVGCGGGQGGCSGGGQGGYTGPACGSGGSSGGQVGYPCPIYVPVPVIGGGCPQQPIGGGCVVTPVPGYPGCGQDEPDKGKGMKKMAVAMAPEPMAVDQLTN